MMNGGNKKDVVLDKDDDKSDLFFLIRVYYYQFKAGTAS